MTQSPLILAGRVRAGLSVPIPHLAFTVELTNPRLKGCQSDLSVRQVKISAAMIILWTQACAVGYHEQQLQLSFVESSCIDTNFQTNCGVLI